MTGAEPEEGGEDEQELAATQAGGAAGDRAGGAGEGGAEIRGSRRERDRAWTEEVMRAGPAFVERKVGHPWPPAPPAGRGVDATEMEEL
jgi:hypothetical protein